MGGVEIAHRLIFPSASPLSGSAESRSQTSLAAACASSISRSHAASQNGGDSSAPANVSTPSQSSTDVKESLEYPRAARMHALPRHASTGPGTANNQPVPPSET